MRSFARCSVGLALLGGFVLAAGLRITAETEIRPWVALIVGVLVLASAAALWRRSLLPPIAAFFGGALLLVLTELIWLIWFRPWP